MSIFAGWLFKVGLCSLLHRNNTCACEAEQGQESLLIRAIRPTNRLHVGEKSPVHACAPCLPLQKVRLQCVWEGFCTAATPKLNVTLPRLSGCIPPSARRPSSLHPPPPPLHRLHQATERNKRNKHNSCLGISELNIFHNKNKASSWTDSHISSVRTHTVCPNRTHEFTTSFRYNVI